MFLSGWEKVYKGNEFGDINFEDGEFSRLPTQTKMLLNIENQLDPDAFPNNKPNMKYINQQRWDYYEQSAYVPSIRLCKKIQPDCE